MDTKIFSSKPLSRDLAEFVQDELFIDARTQIFVDRNRVNGSLGEGSLRCYVN